MRRLRFEGVTPVSAETGEVRGNTKGAAARVTTLTVDEEAKQAVAGTPRTQASFDHDVPSPKVAGVVAAPHPRLRHRVHPEPLDAGPPLRLAYVFEQAAKADPASIILYPFDDTIEVL